MKTIEQIKSNYRICEKYDKYYIQEKSIFGWWSNFTKKDLNDILIIGIIILFCVSNIFLILSIINIIVLKTYNPVFIFMIIADIFLFLLYIFYTNFTKYCCEIRDSLTSAKNEVDSLSRKKYIKLQEKEKKKNKTVKYHYFYNDKQLRKEKLKKIM